MGRGIGRRDLPGQRKHHRDRMFGGGDGVAERGVHHDDALGGSGGNLDIIDADAGASDHLEVGCCLDDLRGHLGGRADRQAIIVTDARQQRVLILAEVRFEIHLDTAVLDDFNGSRREFVRYEYTGSHLAILQS